MSHLRVLFLIACQILLYSCTALPVKQDYDTQVDFAKLKRFAWLNDVQQKTGDILADNSLLDSRVREAINNHLNNRSYIQVASDEADFYVSYHYQIDEKIEHRDPYTHIEIGGSRHTHHRHVTVGLGHGDREYEDGLLIIDIFAKDKTHLLWRGMLERRVKYYDDPRKSNARIQQTADAILNRFPPATSE